MLFYLKFFSSTAPIACSFVSAAWSRWADLVPLADRVCSEPAAAQMVPVIKYVEYGPCLELFELPAYSTEKQLPASC